MRKTVTKTIYTPSEVTQEYLWIQAVEEPTTPTDYVRAPEWNFDFGDLGKYWAFVKTV